MAIEQLSGVSSSVKSTSAGESEAASKKPAGTQLDYDSFLKLLIAQMQNQDPLEPMNSSDYVAQLATFSQVEQTVQSNGRLADLLTSSRLTQAEGLIGRTVTSADGTVSGAVVSARIEGDGVIAVLDGGREVRIEDGVAVSSGAR